MVKKISPIVLLAFSLYACGCSIPKSARQAEIYSFTKTEKKLSIGFSKKIEITVKDFRNRIAYEENVEDLQQAVEKYISEHPGMSDAAINNLRKLKVADGATKEEVTFLLGKPDQIRRVSSMNPYGAEGLWIYRISKLDAIMFFIFPVFLVHEGYYLYFKDDVLAGIEKRFMEQMVETSPGPGMYESKTPFGGSDSEDKNKEEEPF
jgi:hypothetical protein